MPLVQEVYWSLYVRVIIVVRGTLEAKMVSRLYCTVIMLRQAFVDTSTSDIAKSLNALLDANLCA